MSPFLPKNQTPARDPHNRLLVLWATPALALDVAGAHSAKHGFFLLLWIHFLVFHDALGKKLAHRRLNETVPRWIEGACIDRESKMVSRKAFQRGFRPVSDPFGGAHGALPVSRERC